MVRLPRRQCEQTLKWNFNTDDSTEIPVQGQFLSFLVVYFEEPCFSNLRGA